MSCQQHFEQVLIENPLPEAGDFFRWSVDVHNIVNKRLGKREVSYEEALTSILAGPQPKSESFNSILFAFLMLIIVLIFIFIRK